jgi:hypothetical protein
VAEIINVGKGKIVSAYVIKARGNIEGYFYPHLASEIEEGKP